MAKLDIDISEVKKLVELVEKYNLEEITVEEAELSVTVKGISSPVAPSVVVHSSGAAHSESQVSAFAEEAEVEELVETEPEEDENVVDVVAPLVGVFYRAPSPDAPLFCEVGDVVEVGSELGLIEAMKVFSPIPSEVAGTVIAIPAENGKLVKQGDVLFKIKLAEG